MLARAILLAASLMWPASVLAQTAAPLVLETKIALGEVSGRIDHLSIDPKRQRLFVAELGNNSLGVVDLAAGKVLRTITGLNEPQGVGYVGFADSVYVDPALIQYSVRIVTATRAPHMVGLKELQPYIMFGASPRASINLILAARALAFVRGRDYALPQDVLDMALDVMRHRLVLSYEALSDNVTGDDLLHKILDRMPAPVVPLHEHTAIRAHA